MTSLAISTDEFNQMRQLIETECGISISDDKVYLIQSRLSKLVIENGCETFKDFYRKANDNIDPKLKEKIVDAMTTNETLWFRDQSPFIALREQLFPQWVEEIRSGKRFRIRIWSAACSTGQEPYSVVMEALEYARKHDAPELVKALSITATDISPSVLFLARNGRYDTISMSRGLPDEMKARYFIEEERFWRLKDEIKAPVKFQQLNLQNSFDALGCFDLVLLRNVAIYFSREFKINLFAKIARILNPGGYLILGASEHLKGYTEEFTARNMGRCYVYEVNQEGLAS